MELRPEQLIAQIALRPLARVYLIAGPETLRVLEAADAVRAQARIEGIGERQVFDVASRDFDWGAFAGHFGAPSLFSARRLIELRLGSGKPGKVGSQAITEFCAMPDSDVVLLMTADEWSRAHHGKWVDQVSRHGIVAIAWAIKPHELPDWIERRLRSRGLTADDAAVSVLAERVEGNLLAAAQEIDKLALLTQNETLDAAAMQSLVAASARYDVFRLMEAALAGQPAQVALILAGLRNEGEAPAGLMPMVIRELWRAVALAKVQAEQGNLGAAMKAQGLWEARQAPFRRALQRHTALARWRQFLRFAGRIDRAIKGRDAGDPWLLMERLLLAVADAQAVRLIAA